jgi:hypothetical protein
MTPPDQERDPDTMRSAHPAGHELQIGGSPDPVHADRAIGHRHEREKREQDEPGNKEPVQESRTAPGPVVLHGHWTTAPALLRRTPPMDNPMLDAP